MPSTFSTPTPIQKSIVHTNNNGVEMSVHESTWGYHPDGTQLARYGIFWYKVTGLTSLGHLIIDIANGPYAQ